MYAGIDYSISCPAITVGSTDNFEDCKTFYYIKMKKFEGHFGKNIYGMRELPYEHQMERINNILQWSMAILEKFNVSEVCLEGYSFSSNGRAFDIGENTGILKHALWKANIRCFVPPPTTVKKYFTGKGNAKKDVMHDSFVEKTCIDLTTVLPCKNDKNPISDIVDSYAMLCYGIDNHFNNK